MRRTASGTFAVVLWAVVSGPVGSARAQGLNRVWAKDDGEKIRRDDLNHPLATSQDNPVWDGTTIRLSAAKSEIVAFQLILENGPADLQDVDVTFDGLENGDYRIDNSGWNGDVYDYRGRRIEFFTEHYVHVQSNEAGFTWWWSGAKPLDIYDHDFTGWLPDALIPFEAPSGLGGAPFAIAASQNQAVWIDVYVPKDAPAGDYTGEIQVSVGGTVTHTIPVVLHVYDFVLPDEVQGQTPHHVLHRHVRPAGPR